MGLKMLYSSPEEEGMWSLGSIEVISESYNFQTHTDT